MYANAIRKPVRKAVRASVSSLMLRLLSRYFSRNSSTRYATIPAVRPAGDFVIEFDFLSAAVSANQNIINFGDFLIRIQSDTQINVWGSVDFAPAVFAVPELGTQIHNIRIFGNTNSTSITLYLDGVLIGTANGGSAPVFSGSWLLLQWNDKHFNGILANLKIWDNGSLIRDYPLDDPKGTDVIVNRATELGEELWPYSDAVDYDLGGPYRLISGTNGGSPVAAGVTYLVSAYLDTNGNTYFETGSTTGAARKLFPPTTGWVTFTVSTPDPTTNSSMRWSTSGNGPFTGSITNMSIRQADGYGTIVNGNDEDKGLFQQQVTGEWLGVDVISQPINLNSDWAATPAAVIESVNEFSGSSVGGVYYNTAEVGRSYRLTSDISGDISDLQIKNSAGLGIGTNIVSDVQLGVAITDFVTDDTGIYLRVSGLSPFTTIVINKLRLKEVLKNA